MCYGVYITYILCIRKRLCGRPSFISIKQRSLDVGSRLLGNVLWCITYILCKGNGYVVGLVSFPSKERKAKGFSMWVWPVVPM